MTIQKQGLRTPPRSIEAEQSVLGAVLVDNKALLTALDILSPDGADFYQPEHRIIFKSMYGLAEKQQPIDIVTLSSDVQIQEELSGVGGLPYLAEIVEAVPTAANIAYYAKIVKEHAVRRYLIGRSSELITEVYEENNLDELINCFQRDLSKTALNIARTYTHARDLAKEVFEELESIAASGTNITGIPSGFMDLDKILGGFQPTDLILVAGRPSMGKAQPMDAKLLTPTGWKRMGDIKRGDLVAGSNGDFNRVIGVFPQGIKPVYRVMLTDGSATECCDDHLWYTRTRENRKEKQTGSVKTLEEIRNTIRVNHSDHRLNHSLPYVEPIKFETKELPIEPYLLGVYLGDGESSGNIVITNPETDIQYHICENLPLYDTAVLVDELTLRIKRKHRQSAPSEFKKELCTLGLDRLRSYEKFIPQQYLLASIDDRIQLLRGLCDTDGYVYDSGNGIEYITTSRAMAEDIKFLVSSLGGRITLYEKETHYTKNGIRTPGRRAYKLLISFHNRNIIPVSSKKHLKKWKGTIRETARLIKDVQFVGEKESQCILVDCDDHLYVTDDFILTHNTSLAAQMATYAGVQGKKVGIFTIEVGKKQLMKNILAAQSRTDTGKFRNAKFTESEWEAVGTETGKIYNSNIYFDDHSRYVGEIKRQARRMSTEEGLDIIFIDHLQEMKVEGRHESRALEVGIILSAMKDIAKELAIPVIVLAQLSRKVEGREDKQPVLSDLKESGAGEEKADVILFIYRDEYYAKDKSETPNMADIIVAKQRHGATSACQLRWNSHCVRFDNLSIHGDYDHYTERTEASHDIPCPE